MSGLELKIGCRVHLQLGAQQLEQSEVYGLFQNRNFRASNGILAAIFPKQFTHIFVTPLRLDKQHENEVLLKLFFTVLSGPPNGRKSHSAWVETMVTVSTVAAGLRIVLLIDTIPTVGSHKYFLLIRSRKNVSHSTCFILDSTFEVSGIGIPT